jgi:hypothetical protein
MGLGQTPLRLCDPLAAGRELPEPLLVLPPLLHALAAMMMLSAPASSASLRFLLIGLSPRRDGIGVRVEA